MVTATPESARTMRPGRPLRRGGQSPREGVRGERTSHSCAARGSRRASMRSGSTPARGRSTRWPGQLTSAPRVS